MKSAILPKNIECVMVWPANVTSTTKGPGTFVVVLHQSAPCAPWYTMYAVHEYTPHRRTTQKGPHGHHLQPHQSRVLRYRRHAAHEPAHGVPRTVAAIRALRERGVLFGLCTGRDAHATEAMYELWGIEGLVDVLVAAVAPRSSTARTTSTS